MVEIMDEVLRLGSEGRHQEIAGYLLEQSHDTGLFLAAATHLLRHRSFAAAAHLSNALVRVGVDHPVTQLGRAVGALIANDQNVLDESTASLAQHFSALGREEQSLFLVETLNPVLLQFVAMALQTNDDAMLLRVLEVNKVWAPPLRRIFDWTADAAPLSASSGNRSSLIAYRSPPEGAVRVPYRTVVAMRERMFPQKPESRILDIGSRFAHAASQYGWLARFCPLTFQDLEADFRAIIAHCSTLKAEVLIYDDQLIHFETHHAFRNLLIDSLRQALPSIKIVAVYFDSWEIAPDFLKRMAPEVDVLWATTPSMPVWSDPIFNGKLLQAPLAHAGNLSPPDAAPLNRISFVGGLMGYNWHRAYWRAAAIRDGLPIDWQLSTHLTDGLPPLESYAGYMRRLAASGCSLNLSMRSDLSRIITDRTFESLLAGTFLIQEAAEDLDYFFVAGEHYLPFTTYADLRAVSDVVTSQPERVQAIRRAGHDFAVSRYADDKLIGYLDAILFHL